VLCSLRDAVDLAPPSLVAPLLAAARDLLHFLLPPILGGNSRVS
jgi:hypothetical protein